MLYADDDGAAEFVCSGEVDEAFDLVGVQQQAREQTLRRAELRRLACLEALSERAESEIKVSFAARELPEKAPTIVEDCSSVHLYGSDFGLRQVRPKEAITIRGSYQGSVAEERLDTKAIGNELLAVRGPR